MIRHKNNLALAVFSMALGMLIMAWLNKSAIFSYSNKVESESKPLYWVAPMDANYRRDKPGKSPMGMDLVAVYKTEDTDVAGPGLIKISPEVVNNLGVRTYTAQNLAMQTNIKTVGYVQYDQDRIVHIHPRVEGWVEKLYVKATGDPVEKGEALYELYSPQLVNAQEELLLAITRNNTQLVEAAEARLRTLHIAENFIVNFRKKKKVQQRVIFYAPQSGVIDNLNIREGFYVEPGTTMMSVSTLDEVWVEAEIFERQIAQIQLDQSVTMTLDYFPGREWLGKVDYIYPVLNPTTRTVRVRLRFNNEDKLLKPNMLASVYIHGKPSRALVVPLEALIRTGRQDRLVLALGEGRFKSIEVIRGRIFDEYAEIIDGLVEGEQVVSSAQFLLDSESSKTSDFKRMHKNMVAPEFVWIEAEINEIREDDSALGLSHGAIEEWNMAAMSMNFEVLEEVHWDGLKVGMRIKVKISRNKNNQLKIVDIRVVNGNTDHD